MYAYSKFQFDQYVRSQHANLHHQVVGFRYFNVYGPRESHKQSMSSTPFHFHNQLISNGKLCLFQASHGYEDGEQQRDFVYVEDCVKVNLWFLDHPNKSGIFNVGTGHATTFNKIASSVLKWNQNHGRDGEIVYIPFPEHLKGAYQSFTQADISALRAAGYEGDFITTDDGINAYLDWLNMNPNFTC